MSPRAQHNLVLASTTGAVVFLLCAVAVLTRGGLLPLDEEAATSAARATSGWIAFATLLDLLGGTRVVVGVSLLAVLALFLRGHRWAALRLGVIIVGVQAGSFVLKHLIARPRPDHALIEATGYAFPSGHASSAAAFAVLALWYASHTRSKELPVVALAMGSLWALASASSRVILGVHSATDVLGGIAYGTASACFGLLLTTWAERRWPWGLQPREPM